jgi:hypothetical protein
MADTVTSQGDVAPFLQPAVGQLLTNAGTAASTPYAGLNSYYTATGGATPFAQFNPLQKQAFGESESLGPSQYTGQGANMAGAAGLGSLMAGQNYMGMASNPYAVQQFMSPYMQNVVEQQKRSAMQDYSRQIPGQQAQSIRMGGRGGTRDALIQAENNRNLQNSLQGIQATGSQQAYQGAQDILNRGTQFGLQGYNQGLNAASTLGQLGGQQFNQQLQAIQNRAAMGKDIFGTESDVAKAKYADYQNMMNDPMNRAKFMSGIISQIPISARQTSAGSSSGADWASAIGSILASYMGNKP